MERLAEVHAAGRFAYGGQKVRFDVRDLLVEACAVQIAELGKDGERLLAGNLAYRNAPPIGTPGEGASCLGDGRQGLMVG